MLDIVEKVTFSVVVTPGSSKYKVGKVHGDSIKVYVSAAPEKGKANDAVIKLLARELDVPMCDVQIVSGHTTKRKRICVEGASKQDVLKIIEE